MINGFPTFFTHVTTIYHSEMPLPQWSAEVVQHRPDTCMTLLSIETVKPISLVVEVELFWQGYRTAKKKVSIR